jgi:catechol 2,3-dioxygenase-like lactoylglutathione lyase family enzyme
MKTQLSHIELKVSNPEYSFPFYSSLLVYLGYRIIHQDKICIGFFNPPNQIWLTKTRDKYVDVPFHRQHTGINHIAFKVESQKDVDKFYTEFLQPKNIPTLYQTPKLFPEYTPDYYAVFFEDPDRIKIEVNYHS